MIEDDLRFAFELADTAAEMSRGAFHTREFRTDAKPDGSVATDIDRRVETVLRDMLAGRHPTDAVVGEEFGGTSTGGRCWSSPPRGPLTGYSAKHKAAATTVRERGWQRKRLAAPDAECVAAYTGRPHSRARPEGPAAGGGYNGGIMVLVGPGRSSPWPLPRPFRA